MPRGPWGCSSSTPYASWPTPRMRGPWTSSGSPLVGIGQPYTARTDPPVIVQDLPTAAYAYAGGNATLSIMADGAPTLHYQWKKGASPVGSDSPTLTLTGLTTGNSGNYSVTINNSYGSTNSATCLLTVLASPDLYTDQVLPDAPGATGRSTRRWLPPPTTIPAAARTAPRMAA